MIYIGIDNGITGSIGIILNDRTPLFYKIPTRSEQDYTKAKKNITRIDQKGLLALINYPSAKVKVVIERPMVNPQRFKATTSALRALESMLIAVESLKYPHMYIDSKEWQKILPNGVKGSTELKKASADIGCRLFPQHESLIRKQKDADGLLIAEYARRVGL